ncbi:MAG: hypothetical protein Q8Q33_00240 [Chlamydiota bacterium]|nr:hypothetical protein [Chlamydiota bacterium]
MRPWASKESGLTLMVVILMMMLLALFGTVLISEMGSGVTTTVHELDAVLAAGLADGAQELAQRWLIDNPQWDQNGLSPQTSDFPDTTFGRGSFTVSTQYPNTLLTANMTLGVLTANVSSTSIFASSGLLKIDQELIAYSGKSVSAFTGLSRGLGGTSPAAHSSGAPVYPAATLSSAINATVTTIAVSNTLGFLDSGTIQVGSELMDYKGKTTNSFVDLERGAYSSTAATHASGDVVLPGVPQCQVTTVGMVGTAGDIGYAQRTFRKSYIALTSTSGGPGGTGTIDTVGGDGTTPVLYRPEGVVVDAAAKYLYIAEFGNDRVRRVDLTNPDPPSTITTIAGTGSPGYNGEGLATTHQLYNPRDVALDPTGQYLYIADTTNKRIRRVDLTTGMMTTFAGSGSNCNNPNEPCGDGGLATAALFNDVRGVDVDSTGIVYIVDSGRARIRRVLLNGNIYHFAGPPTGGSGDSPSGSSFVPLTSGLFNNLERVCIGPTDNLIYIADYSNHEIRLANATTNLINNVAGTGTGGFLGDGGPATIARINRPIDLDVDLDGNLYLADQNNNRIRKISSGADGIVTGSADEIISTVAGDGSSFYTPSDDGGPATSASLSTPSGISVDADQNFYIGDRDHQRARSVTNGSDIVMAVDWRELFQ